MALTDGFIAMIIALGITYYFLFTSPTRWKRMAGAVGVILIGVSLGTVEDTIPMFVLSMINLGIGLMKLAEEVATLVKIR